MNGAQPSEPVVSVSEQLRAGLEALLFLAEEPISVPELAEVLERDEGEVLRLLEELRDDYHRAHRGIEIRRAAGGWRMYSAPLARPVLERWALAGRTGRLTQAALETLAIIAYKQPIGRQAIGDIRGVNPDGAVRSLVARGFVVEVGRDDGPGHAVLYGTTTVFLERLGIDSLEALPPITEYLPEAPAPDEPELHALREVRRRLAAAGGLGDPAPTPSGAGPADAGVHSGGPGIAAPVEQDPDETDLLPPPSPPSATANDPQMDQLTDRLDRVARGALQRLRAAIAAGDPAAELDVGPDAAPDTDPDVGSGAEPDVGPGADVAGDRSAQPTSETGSPPPGEPQDPGGRHG